MVTFFTSRPLALSAAGGALFLLASCGSGVGDASPRVGQIPQQVTSGGTMFALDLAPYVVDPEGTALTFGVVSGGGSFTGSTYNNMFETMGTYAVVFTATDAQGLQTVSTFDVEVTSANFAVVRVDDDGLQLWDTDTGSSLNVTASSQLPSFAAGLARGQLVYQLANGPNQRLMVFDPATRKSTELGKGFGETAVYLTRTSGDDVLFRGGSNSDPDLLLWEPLTGLTRVVSNALGETDGNPMVNAGDLVFYERGAGGQADVFYYDPSVDDSTAVSTNPRNETLRAVLPDGAAVFSRVGDSGEHDLFYFRVGTGLVEVGADMPGLAPLHKTYAGSGSGSQVVFGVQNGADQDLYFWNPANGQTTAISTGAVSVFEAVTVQDEVVYRVEVGGSDHDLFWHDMTDNGSGTVADTTDLLTFRAVTTDGSSTFVVYQDSTPTELFVYDVTANSAANTTGAGDLRLDAVLDSGNLVWSRVDGTAIGLFDVTAGSDLFSATGTGVAFAGAGSATDDFLWTADAGGQDDLFLYDASAPGQVTVSNDAGDDSFQAMTSAGWVLFTRVVTGNSNTDLFAWNPNDLSTLRLTMEDAQGELHDHEVLGTYRGER